MRKPVWTTVCCAVLALLCVAPAGADEEAPESHHVARLAGQRALEAGRTEEAIEHFQTALLDYPGSSLLLEDLLEATAQDADAHAWWRHRYVAAIASAKGSFRPARRVQALVSTKDADLVGVATARAKAAQELLRLGTSAQKGGRYVLARVCARLLQQVADGAPALLAEQGAQLLKAMERTRPVTAEVLAAVEVSSGRIGGAAQAPLRLELGRALLGLASQARQKAQGAPAGMDARLKNLGDRLVTSALQELAAQQMQPLTVPALEAMDRDAIRDFNERHTLIASPGRALSPSGRYEVLTPCGHGTLLAGAREVDAVHARLAAWFAQDPFASQRGQIRIFPEFADLEAEDAPYWWAQGFQRGAITVVRFALDTPMGLARILTHELTHRFDARIYPGLPKWMVEGRAVWTAAAMRSLGDAELAPFAADIDRIVDAPSARYANAQGLERLLRDQPSDYRDNYTIGHALWTYLWCWEHEPGQLTYRGRMPAYLDGLQQRGRDPVALFVACFADGVEGRPQGLAAFADRLREFLDGLQRYPYAEWSERWFALRGGSDGPGAMLLDGPTLSRSRDRNEPTFGQEQMERIAHLLASAGEAAAAAALLEWAWAHDELLGPGVTRLVELLDGVGAPLPAAAARLERLRRDPARIEAQDREGLLPLATAPLRAYLAALGTTAAQQLSLGHARTALWFQDEHDRLAVWFGLEPLPMDEPPTQPAGHVPHLGAPRRLDEAGWSSDALVGFENRRAPDMWHVTPETHLVLGRKAEDTAALTHVERYLDVSVRSQLLSEANYVFQTRIHLLAPYIRGAVVLGWQRRDRNVQLHFGAGRAPRPGEGAQEMKPHTGAWFRVDGLRPFDGVHSGGTPRQGVGLQEGRNSFVLTVRVNGPKLECWADRTWLGTFCDAQGLPLDGAIGFAVSAGIVRVESPVILPLRVRTRSSGHPIPQDIDPDQPREPLGGWALGYRMRGLAPGAFGAIVLWCPLGHPGAAPEKLAAFLEEAQGIWRELRADLERRRHGARILLLIPWRWPETARKQTLLAFEQEVGSRGEVRLHGEGTRPGASVDPAAWGDEWVQALLDPQGIVRVLSHGIVRAGVDGWEQWLALTRGF